MVTIEKLSTGAAIAAAIDSVATLRLEIFREYPYLYDGRFRDELSYLRNYTEAADSCVITVADKGVVIGAATGIPLHAEDHALRDPVEAASYPVDEIYYVGELLFYREYRNRGLGIKLLAMMEEYVLSLGNYRYLACATVNRPDDHPLRPADYLPIDRFLARTSFALLPGATTTFRWLEIDGQRRDHAMQFWTKNLNGRKLLDEFSSNS